jgi:hypothetical protein
MSREATRDLLEAVFTERKKAVIRGRQEGPRRPKRSTKAGYKGRGYSGPGGKMKGRDLSGEQPAPRLPGEPMSDAEKKKRITEFEGLDDWVLSMILVSLMHADPDLTPEQAIEEGKKWVRKLYMPRTSHLWREQTTRIKRNGVRAEASKIRRELFKML